MKLNKGTICVALSAVIFGFTPIMAKITYAGGSNGITTTFLRMILCLPFLLGLIKAKKISIKISKKQLMNTMILGAVGVACTTILLYLSYTYLPVGLSTTLHFIYPLIIVLACTAMFREKMGKLKWIAVGLVTLGILTFIEKGSGTKMFGAVIALISGLFYAFYILFSDKAGLKDLNCFVLAFYACISAAVTTFIFGMSTHALTFILTPKAWIFSTLVALFTSLGAIPLMQIGIREVGASTAGILSTLEPITSVICGILVLGETISPMKIIGCVLILTGVILTQKSQTDECDEQQLLIEETEKAVQL